MIYILMGLSALLGMVIVGVGLVALVATILGWLLKDG